MNSKNIWSLLLLIAMSFSLVHDYTFVSLDNDKHSVQEYISELTTHSSNKDGFKHDIHSEYHNLYLCPTNTLLFSNTEKVESTFQYNEIFLSWNYFNFYKPPIA